MSAFGKYPPPRNFNNIPSGYPVCTVVSFNADGDFIPVSFGIVINSERFRYQITDIKSIRDNCGIRTFECGYEAYGQVRTVLLRFDVKGCRWTVG
jgi:hypothetical protein